jgi:acyl-CoA thioester hydrolase
MLSLRWGDLDAFGHLNNVQFFRLMEQTRVEWLESLGLFPPAGSAAFADPQLTMPVVARLDCTFRQPVHYPAKLAVTLLAGRAGRSSLETWHEIRSADGTVLYAEGGATLVWISVASGRPEGLPPAVRAAAGSADAD